MKLNYAQVGHFVPYIRWAEELVCIGLIDAIADRLRASGLQSKLDALEARRAELQQQLKAAPVAAPRLHPNLAEIYRHKVEQLQAAFAGRRSGCPGGSAGADRAGGAAPWAGRA